MTKKCRSKYAGFAIVLVLVSLIAGTFLVHKIINHESNQNDRISVLEGQIGLVREELKQAKHPTDEIWLRGGTAI